MFPYLGRFKLTARRCYLDTATRPYQQHCYKAPPVIICADSHAISARPHCGVCRCLLGTDVYQQLVLLVKIYGGGFDFFIDRQGNFFSASEQLGVVLLTLTQNTTPAAFPPSCMSFLDDSYFKWFSH